MNKELLKSVTTEVIDENTVKYIAPEVVDEDGFDVLRFELNNYEGPLDLLIDLIKDSKIDIEDIFVSKITEQYLAVMRSWEFLDMDKASEFISTAATLLEIKSKHLLPRDEEDDEIDDVESDFKRQIEEYMLFKEASELLKPYEKINKFYREPKYTDDDSRIIVNDFSFDKLVSAFALMLHKVEVSEIVKDTTPKEIVRDRFTVADKIKYISEVVKKQNSVSFFSLFEEDYTKSEAINTFLAILELLKKQFISAEQGELFSDIIITYKGEEEGDIGELETEY